MENPLIRVENVRDILVENHKWQRKDKETFSPESYDYEKEKVN